jgi:hypothetical protein
MHPRLEIVENDIAVEVLSIVEYSNGSKIHEWTIAPQIKPDRVLMSRPDTIPS